MGKIIIIILSLLLSSNVIAYTGGSVTCSNQSTFKTGDTVDIQFLAQKNNDGLGSVYLQAPGENIPTAYVVDQYQNLINAKSVVLTDGNVLLNYYTDSALSISNVNCTKNTGGYNNLLFGFAGICCALLLTGMYFITDGNSGIGKAAHDFPSFSGTTGQYVRGNGTVANFPTIPPAQVQSDWNQSNNSAIDFVKNKPSQTPQEHWHNGVLRSTGRKITFTGTTTGGAVTFYMTNGGGSGGAALCTQTPDHVDIYIVDATNTYGWGHTITNSNKNLNISVNVRTFTSGNALLNLIGGLVSVLTGTSLSPAPNGTVVIAEVSCI